MIEISIITPTYNGERFLAGTIQSVINQTATEWEMIIVDDGSEDATVALAETFIARNPRIKLIRQTNGGVATARTRGYAESDPASQFILFLDQDDVLEPEALQGLRDALTADVEAVAAHGLARYIDDQGCVWRPGEAEALTLKRFKVQGKRLIDVKGGEPTTFSTLVYRNCIWTPGQVLIRKTALAIAGPFNQQTAPCDDWDMWLRLTNQGHITAIEKVALNFRRHSNNNSGNRKLMRSAELALRRHLLELTSSSKTKRNIALIGYRYCEFHSGILTLRIAKQSLIQGHILHSLKYLRHVFIFCARAVPGTPI